MQTYSETRADERKRIDTEKRLRAALREAGIRVPKFRHSAAFEAGARAKIAKTGGEERI